MKYARAASVRRYVGTFQYGSKLITFHFWSHLRNGEMPDTVVFLGTAQTGRIAQWAAQAAPFGVIVIEGAPHWHAHPSAQDLYEFMYAYTIAAFRAVLKEFGIASAHVVAQSQAAPGVVKLGIDHADTVNNIVLFAPLGFAVPAFGATPEVRIRTLMRRGSRTFLQLSQSPLYDPRNIYVGLMLLRAILMESERGASGRKYATGLAYDMREDCRVLGRRQFEKDRALTLLLGGKDKVFTVEEIQPLVEAENIAGMQTKVLPGISHLSLAVRGNKRVLRAATDIARGEAQELSKARSIMAASS